MSAVELRELAYIAVSVVPRYLVSIAVIFQLMLSMMNDISVRDTVYVGLYGSGGKNLKEPKFNES